MYSAVWTQYGEYAQNVCYYFYNYLGDGGEEVLYATPFSLSYFQEKPIYKFTLCSLPISLWVFLIFSI
jgi:hypothetical protein